MPALIGAATVAWRRINAEFEFTVAEASDGLRLRCGLLQTRAETIPYARIQAVRWIEPLLWRPFGWCRLEVDVARRHGARDVESEGRLVSRALLPVGLAADATWLLSRVLPGATAQPPPGTAPPQRAVLRAPFSYVNLRAWHDEHYVIARTGRLRRTVTIVPLHKVQSLRWVQGPVQRALRLGTVHADTAGRGWQAIARCRDERESKALIERLTDLAHAARLATA